jgi:hypothetical protein
MGPSESDSLRGHSIKGLKQSNQHTFFWPGSFLYSAREPTEIINLKSAHFRRWEKTNPDDAEIFFFSFLF